MKKLCIIALALICTSSSASAFDLGSVAGAVTGDKCIVKAASLAEKAKNNAVVIFEKMSADSALTASDLNISDATFSTAASYVKEGCAKEHLTKAISLAAGAAAQ